MTVDVAVSNAYSKGGIPLTIAGVANLKVAGHRPLLANALERLLGPGRPQIIQVAKATLERNLRGVLSQLNPEEVNRILTDHTATLRFACVESAMDCLARENLLRNAFLVGDPMYDAFLYYRKLAMSW